MPSIIEEINRAIVDRKLGVLFYGTRINTINGNHATVAGELVAVLAVTDGVVHVLTSKNRIGTIYAFDICRWL